MGKFDDHGYLFLSENRPFTLAAFTISMCTTCLSKMYFTYWIIHAALSGQFKGIRRVITVYILRTHFTCQKFSKISTLLPFITTATNFFIPHLPQLILPLVHIVLCAQSLVHSLPYTLTALHVLCGTIGMSILLHLQLSDNVPNQLSPPPFFSSSLLAISIFNSSSKPSY